MTQTQSSETAQKTAEKTTRDVVISGLAGLPGGLFGVPLSIGSYLLWRRIGLNGASRWWAWAATGIIGIPMGLGLTASMSSSPNSTSSSSPSASQSGSTGAPAPTKAPIVSPVIAASTPSKTSGAVPDVPEWPSDAPQTRKLSVEIEAELDQAVETEWPDADAVEKWKVKDAFRKYAATVCHVSARGITIPNDKNLTAYTNDLARRSCKS